MDCLFIQGAAGSGKTTLARSLANELGWRHLDRDNFSGDRPTAYGKLRDQLKKSLEKGEGVIVDAPFLYEGEKEFLAWQKGLPSFPYLIVSLQMAPEERRKRRERRNLERDRVDDWQSLLLHEEDSYKTLPGALRLPGTLASEVLSEIILWHLEADGRRIRLAQKEDLPLLQSLKEKILVDTFSEFLDGLELEKEVKQVGSLAAVERMFQENDLFLAEKEGEPWAMLALSGVLDDEGKRYRKIFSGYSNGSRAASALGALLISRAEEEGLDYLLAWVYRDNQQSKRVMTSFGFRPTGESHENPMVPRLPVEHWILPLS